MKNKSLIVFSSTLILAASISSCESPANESNSEVAKETTEVAIEETKPSVSGKELFTSSGCIACHQAETKTVGPSIKEIAEAYSGNKTGLNDFLTGNGEAIIDPAQAAIMQPQIETTKKMSDVDRNAIVDYLLNI